MFVVSSFAARAGVLPLPHSPSKTGVNALFGERVGVRGQVTLLSSLTLMRLAEPVIGPRFARTRWPADLSPQERGKANAWRMLPESIKSE